LDSAIARSTVISVVSGMSSKLSPRRTSSVATRPRPSGRSTTSSSFCAGNACWTVIQRMNSSLDAVPTHAGISSSPKRVSGSASSAAVVSVSWIASDALVTRLSLRGAERWAGRVEVSRARRDLGADARDATPRRAALAMVDDAMVIGVSIPIPGRGGASERRRLCARGDVSRAIYSGEDLIGLKSLEI